MKIEDIVWSQGCCGEAVRFAEFAISDGWLRVKEADGGYTIMRFGVDKQLTSGPAFATAQELQALIE